VEALILVEVLVGRADETGHDIERIPGIRASDVVTGCYDVIARAEGEDREALGRMLEEVRAMPSVTRALVCPVGPSEEAVMAARGERVLAGVGFRESCG
jgi:hypothetical protein